MYLFQGNNDVLRVTGKASWSPEKNKDCKTKALRTTTNLCLMTLDKSLLFVYKPPIYKMGGIIVDSIPPNRNRSNINY